MGLTMYFKFSIYLAAITFHIYIYEALFNTNSVGDFHFFLLI